jgi:methylated-DNA-[protein]-cysteine S-methyltransferase
MRYSIYDSPIGPLYMTADAIGTALTGLYTGGKYNGGSSGIDVLSEKTPRDDWYKTDDLELFVELKNQLELYFAGRLKEFDVPFIVSGTEFQQSVWAELCRIPYGQTISYGELAIRIGNPKSVRAVGLANGRNRISIIIPCHRVIGADGSLTGYAGGVENKKSLLMHEGAIMAPGASEVEQLTLAYQLTNSQ